jgi:quinol-cytochrome oxidoreductase complex cytochrome b subunit
MAGYVPYIGDTVQEILLGGVTVSSATLLRFYVLHVAVLPAAVVVTLAVHLWRWRKDSMLSVDGASDE